MIKEQIVAVTGIQEMIQDVVGCDLGIICKSFERIIVVKDDVKLIETDPWFAREIELYIFIAVNHNPLEIT